MKITQTIATKNDSNGNPRRLQLVWLAVETQQDPYGDLLEAIDHGYAGKPRNLDAVDIGSIKVAPAEYNRIKRDAKARGKYSAR